MVVSKGGADTPGKTRQVIQVFMVLHDGQSEDLRV